MFANHSGHAGGKRQVNTNHKGLPMKKILFIDRDGTIIEEPPGDCQVDSLEKLAFKPGVIGALRSIARNTDYRLVMVTNQDGLGTARFPWEDFRLPHEFMLRTLAGEGVVFDEVLIDCSLPEDDYPNRKPGTGMVAAYLNEALDYGHSYVIGDRLTDMELARNMGIQGIYLGAGEAEGLPVVFKSLAWDSIADFLIRGSRRAHQIRKTEETCVEVRLDLNGRGEGDIHTGIGFFDHLLQQLARHGRLDLFIRAEGDLHVDEHHTIEDTAIVLGSCFSEALGSKKGIARYGFCLPMDESRADVLLDFGGRSWLEWDVPCLRDYVGDFPTDMAKHFFASFCQSAACNIWVKAQGENEHHILEAVFKAFARSIRQAVASTGDGLIASTKGTI